MSRPTKAPSLWPPQYRLRSVELDPARLLTILKTVFPVFAESKTYGCFVAVPRFLGEITATPLIRKFSNKMNQLVDSAAYLLTNPQATAAQAAAFFARSPMRCNRPMTSSQKYGSSPI